MVLNEVGVVTFCRLKIGHQFATGGSCWTARINNTCTNLISARMTREQCCHASSQTTTSTYYLPIQLRDNNIIEFYLTLSLGDADCVAACSHINNSVTGQYLIWNLAGTPLFDKSSTKLPQYCACLTLRQQLYYNWGMSCIGFLRVNSRTCTFKGHL